MPKVTPMEGADKLKRGIQSHGTDYLAGVNKVTENPATKAIENKEKWYAAITDAHNNDRYAKGLANVTLASWKQSVNDGGVSRYTGSAEKAASNYMKFAQEFYPYVAQVQAQIATMANRTLQDNIQRMITNVNMLHDYKNR